MGIDIEILKRHFNSVDMQDKNMKQLIMTCLD